MTPENGRADALAGYETVRRWAASFQRNPLRPVDERQRKLDLLGRFCEVVEVDPDTMVATARADKEAKNAYLRTLVRWARELPGTERERHDAENTIRSFFMKNGFRIMTKPYQDVYRRDVSR
jgi:hypothetical protein